MYNKVHSILEEELDDIRKEGLYKAERLISTPQGPRIKVAKKVVLNFCANNYLGLASDKRLIEAAKEGMDRYGFGMSSVRFICGTQDIHKDLEGKISYFLDTDDTILYSSCFDANGGLFEALLSKEDVVISDALNHASIIDGIRLCKAERKVFKHADMNELEDKLKGSKNFRTRLIATDGVFSMDGDIAGLKNITSLAEKYDALVMVDDSHAMGFVGKTGKGSGEVHGVMDRVDIITSTLGKAMGGASGGFTTGRSKIIEYLRQKSRPYLFSNTLAPPIVYASIKAVQIIREADDLREKLRDNTDYFRIKMAQAGFEIKPGSHPIVPIMLRDAKLAQDVAKDLLDEGIYVIGFSYPVVPKGEARIRVQISAAHSREELDKAIDAFEKVGKKYGVV